MVTTSGPSSGGSGYEYGENTVAARLSIDIPTEGVQSLREITQEISRFRTEMEAASRSEGDFIGFFQNLPSIASQAANAFKTYADQLERGLELQQRMSGAVGQWDVQPGSSPDNFKGMTSGMGRSSGDVNQQVADLDRLREMGPAGERQYLNVHQQRGATQSGDIPTSNSQSEIAAATERISARERINQERTGDSGRAGGGGIAREIMNEYAAGAGVGGSGTIGRILRRGIGAVKDRASKTDSSGGNEEDHESGAIPTPKSGTMGAVGALGKFLPGGFGMAASAAGMGLAGFEAAQYLGPRIQNLKDAGLVQGGGAKEGLEQEVNARIMALSPFITNDQSRSIIQSALRDGYSGKEYETVTKFMADNIKDFAISVQDSRDMVKTLMVEGGATPGAIGATLEQQKMLSKGSYISFDERKKAMSGSGIVGRAADMGVSFDTASKTVGESLEMFGDSQVTKGLATGMDAAMLSDDLSTEAVLLNLAGITPSSDFSEWSEQLMSGGAETKQKIYRAIASMSSNPGYFRMLVKQFLGQDLTVPQARKLYQDIKSGKSLTAPGKNRIDSVTQGVSEQSSGERLNAGVGSAFSVLGGTIADAVTGNWGNIPGRFRGADFANQSENIPILDKIVEAQGGDPNKILVQDESGNWSKLQPKNSEQLQQLSAGGKWKRADDPSGNGYTLKEAGADKTTFGQKQNVEVQGAVQIHVSTDPGVKVSSAPRTITLTQNQVQSNAGWGNATMNNPPPGDR
jgi:hypothetical protein